MIILMIIRTIIFSCTDLLVLLSYDSQRMVIQLDRDLYHHFLNRILLEHQ